MPCSVSINVLFFISFLFCSPVLSAATESYGAEVKSVVTALKGEQYVLSANINYRLSPKAMEALQNGVALFWTVHIKSQLVRDFLWNKTLAEKHLHYQLQYHALLNMYRVSHKDTQADYNFVSLASALDSISTLNDLPFLDAKILKPAQHQVVALKIDFDNEALPLPLRPITYFNQQWYLSSAWTVWPLTK
ncbi:MAG: DUF4390 domain-containing protein [Methylovulum sp.]|nr:DUF4390 domain-containing protein [Methylovulum sp.]MCF7998799.1 DUF4390 domain-containing protein [Methylovulum sp.]